MQNEAPEEFLRRFLSCSRLRAPGGGGVWAGLGPAPTGNVIPFRIWRKASPVKGGQRASSSGAVVCLALVSITTKSGTFQPPNRGVWRLFDPIRNPRIEQMFFVRKSAGFRRNRGIFFGEKAKKTIAILLQTIYTKKESGAKWRESPP